MSKSRTKRGKGRVNQEPNSDVDESVNDMASNNSNGSPDEDTAIQEDNQLTALTEKFDEKLLQSIENATEKSAQTRSFALQTITEALQHRHVPDFIEDRKITISDIIEKSLRRGKGSEQEWAARLAPLLVIQLGGDNEFSTALCQVLLATLQNQTSAYSVRAWSCTSFTMLNFLNSDDIGDIVLVMQQLEHIFAGSYLKGDKSPLSVSDDAAQLHVAALEGWGLLVTLIPPGDFCTFVRNGSIISSMKKFIGLLQSPHLEVRMTCGEVIALIIECGRNHDENFLDTYFLDTDLIDLTRVIIELANDSQKFRRKKERKAQRSSFRDVLKYLQDDVTPEVQVRFGNETLALTTWSMNIQYEKMCDVIGPGITTHLAENEFLRDIFQLGAKINQLNTGSMNKQTKLERHMLNAAASKARTLSRKKSRDKRSAVFN